MGVRIPPFPLMLYLPKKGDLVYVQLEGTITDICIEGWAFVVHVMNPFSSRAYSGLYAKGHIIWVREVTTSVSSYPLQIKLEEIVEIKSS